VCEFQQALLTLEAQQIDSNESLLVAMRTYSGAPLVLSFLITEGLVADTNYTMFAVVTTVAGNVSKEMLFSKFISFVPQKCNYGRHCCRYYYYIGSIFQKW